MFILAIITCSFWLVVLVDAKIGMRKIIKLESVQPDITKGPLVSIIVAAKDEEKDIKESILSQLNQTYENVEWIIVNDRSDDKTGDIIDKLSNYDPRIKTIHIQELPEFWLGKNYALFKGYKESNGDYLLFTDADIMYEKTMISRAVTYFQQKELDHLTVAPNLKGRSFWTNAFISFFLFGFSYFKRPWKANDEKSKAAIGIGAFNLLRRDVYEAIGTHQEISMRPDDDLMLGLKVKNAGKRQNLLLAQNLLEVEWYPSLRSALIGLEKNTFAGLFYSYLMVAFALCGVFISQVWPFMAMFFTEGITRYLFIISILIIFFTYHQTANLMTKGANKYFFVFPITALIFMYSIIRATILTTIRGGIVWRGTFYSIKDLKRKV
ncbi:MULTISPECIES: glycosyltransferase [Bacillus]|uniref:glycosyltransferase n=1 Tax=Bacillus TaxID=1386 RepID=UPI000BB7E844|nr:MULTISPECIES: glycosyltransferase family 2 protein [Bacillus]